MPARGTIRLNSPESRFGISARLVISTLGTGKAESGHQGFELHRKVEEGLGAKAFLNLAEKFLKGAGLVHASNITIGDYLVFFDTRGPTVDNWEAAFNTARASEQAEREEGGVWIRGSGVTESLELEEIASYSRRHHPNDPPVTIQIFANPLDWMMRPDEDHWRWRRRLSPVVGDPKLVRDFNRRYAQLIGGYIERYEQSLHECFPAGLVSGESHVDFSKVNLWAGVF